MVLRLRPERCRLPPLYRHWLLEACEGLTHADGRLWSTWRRLITRSGELTRDYLDGKRAPQVPPFRLFLIGIVILLLAGPISNLGPNKTHIQFADPNAASQRGILIKSSGAFGVGAPPTGSTPAWLGRRRP